MQHRPGENVVHEQLVPFVEQILSPSPLMEEIEKEIQSRLKVDAEFIKLLVEALMTPAPVSTQRDANAWYNEYICRKHHIPVCNPDIPVMLGEVNIVRLWV
jgi:hypothetical protein